MKTEMAFHSQFRSYAMEYTHTRAVSV